MIDAEAMQDAIREANPIPGVNDLDAGELTRFVAVANTRRAALMQAPTQERTTPPSATPHQRRSKAWAFALAFVVVLAGIGIAVLALGGVDNTPVAGESPTTVATAAPTSIVEDPPADGTWQPVAVGEPWVRSIIDIEAMPGGGFVAVAEEPWAIRWSPDGAEWFDADPQQLVTPFAVPPPEGSLANEVITATSDRVAIVDPVSFGVWLGDPTSGEWKLIRLDAGELEAPPVMRASAANDTEVLVVVQETGSTMLSVEPTEDTPEPFLFSARYAAWIVNTIDETATRHVMPVAGSESAPSPQAAAEWFKDEWVVLFTRRVWVDGEDGWTDRNSLVMTADGISWRVAPFDDATLFNSVTSFTAGPTSMIATICHFGGDSFWYSTDGVEWTESTRTFISHHSTHNEVLGFVAGDLAVSRDGITWSSVPTAGEPIIDYIAASDATLLAARSQRTNDLDEGPSRLWVLTLGGSGS